MDNPGYNYTLTIFKVYNRVKCTNCNNLLMLSVRAETIDVSKTDENRCKQILTSLPCFGTYRLSQFTVIMSLQQNTAYAYDIEYVIFTC